MRKILLILFLLFFFFPLNAYAQVHNSRRAIEELSCYFSTLKETFKIACGQGPTQINDTADRISEAIETLLPVLGFILRSTNVRIAFELYDPLSLLLKRVSLSDPKLLISSEWDYEPYIFPSTIEELPNFVMIGLPAPESDNALILPAAGHEMGHLFWNEHNFSEHLKIRTNAIIPMLSREDVAQFREVFPAINIDSLTEPDGLDTWTTADEWCRQQLVELFCDCTAVLLFGRSFLNVLEYQLTPNILGLRQPRYPRTTFRAKVAAEFAVSNNILVPDNYDSRFRDEEIRLPKSEQYQLGLADSATSRLLPDIKEFAKQVHSRSGLRIPGPYHVNALKGGEDTEYTIALLAFQHLVPPEKVTQLASLVNAAWTLYEQDDPWPEYPHLLSRKEHILNDLLLKSLEVMEFEEKTKSARRENHDDRISMQAYEH